MIAIDDQQVKTDSPAPSRELIEREKREQREALEQARKMLKAAAAPRGKKPSRGGSLSWARGLHENRRAAK